MKLKGHVDKTFYTDNAQSMSSNIKSLKLNLLTILKFVLFLQFLVCSSAQEFRFQQTLYNITMVEGREYLPANIVFPKYERLAIQLSYSDINYVKFTMKARESKRRQNDPKFDIKTIIVGDFAFAVIFSLKRMNRERQDHYTLRLFAELHTKRGILRSASANIDLRIVDNNDGSPYFAKSLYTASVPSNAGLFTPVVRVTAADSDDGKNAVIYYQLENPNFSVDSRSGQVRVMTNRLHLASYEFDVKAYNPVPLSINGGNLATTHVKVAVTPYNSKSPKFSVSMHNSISESGSYFRFTRATAMPRSFRRQSNNKA